MDLIDSHCHLDDDRLDQSRAEVIEKAAASGVRRIVIPATTANRWEKIKALCDGNDGFYPAYGLHPWFVEQHQAAHLRDLDQWLERETPVALGECGLDFYRSRRDEDWQKQLFRKQAQIAFNHGLPLKLCTTPPWLGCRRSSAITSSSALRECTISGSPWLNAICACSRKSCFCQSSSRRDR